MKRTKALSKICHIAKDLYNLANYTVRQRFFRDGHWFRFNELKSLIEHESAYKALPAETSQEILQLLDKNWKAFFRTILEWARFPHKFRGRPRPPRYKPKNGEFLVPFSGQQCRLEDDFLHFPDDLLPPIKIKNRLNFRHVRILPRGNHYIFELVHWRDPQDLKLDPKRMLVIDIGLNNLVACANNAGLRPFVIKGGVIKSINQFYNKKRARLRSIMDKQKIKNATKRTQNLTLKRNNKINDYFHKVTRTITNYCVQNNIGTVILGYNPGWKHRIDMGHQKNQNFVMVPFHKLLSQIKYKAELIGNRVITINEDYTSKCSFLDNEPVQHHLSYRGQRIHRGLFQASDGTLINSDLNGAYNLGKKAFPEAFSVDGIEVRLHPISISI